MGDTYLVSSGAAVLPELGVLGSGENSLLGRTLLVRVSILALAILKDLTDRDRRALDVTTLAPPTCH